MNKDLKIICDTLIERYGYENVDDILLDIEEFNDTNDLYKDKYNAKVKEHKQDLLELEQYKTISIGIDFTDKDRNAIAIMQIFPDHLYQIYGKTFSHNDEVSIQLKELIEQKSKDGYDEFELDYLNNEEMKK